MDTQDLIAIQTEVAMNMPISAAPSPAGIINPSFDPQIDGGIAELIAETVADQTVIPTAAQHTVEQRSFGRAGANHPMVITSITGA